MSRYCRLALFWAFTTGCSLVFNETTQDRGEDDGGLEDTRDGGAQFDADLAQFSCTNPAPNPRVYEATEAIPATVPIRLDLEWMPVGSTLMLCHDELPVNHHIETIDAEGAVIAWVESPLLGSGDEVSAFIVNDGTELTPTWSNQGGGFWHFDDAADRSGSANTLQIGNDGDLIFSSRGSVLAVNQSGDFGVARNANHDDLSAGGTDPGMNDFSIALWVKVDSLNTLNTRVDLLNKGPFNIVTNGGAGPPGFQFFYQWESKRLVLSISDGTARNIGQRASAIMDQIVDGEFHHVGATVDRSAATVTYYVDGVAFTSDVVEEIKVTGSLANTSSLQIGRDHTSSDWTGELDEVFYTGGLLPADWFRVTHAAGNPDPGFQILVTQ